MKIVSTMLMMALALSSFGCSNSNDELAMQEAKNRELYAQLQREREINAQHERELNALRWQAMNAQRAQAASMQRERELNARREGEANAQRAPEPAQQRPNLARPTNQPRQGAVPAKVTQDAEKAIPKDNFANAAIDDGFRRWSSTWMFDRYVPGSAHATDRGFKDSTYIIRGMFDFVRGGARLTIPFAAAFTGAGDAYRLSNLCYNDNTSGMTDCIDPGNGIQRAAAQSRQFLGSIVLLGLFAAMTAPDDGQICEKRTPFFGEPYFVCY